MPGNLEPHRHNPSAGERTSARVPPAVGVDFADPKRRVGRGPEEPDPVAEAGGHPPSAGVVGADQRRLGASGKLDEGIFQRGYRAVALQVVGFDVVDDRDGRVERQERLVVFIGLDHVQRVARQAGHCRPSRSPGRPRARWDASPAAVSASVVMTVVVVLPCVPAAATLRAPATSAASASFRGTTGTPSIARANEFRMIGLHRGGHDDGTRAFHVRRVMAPMDCRPERRHVGRSGRIIVTPTDGDPAPAGDQRKRAHARPADPHEVDRSPVVQR